MTNPIPEYDNSVLLSALLSGGVIGGSLMLVDRGFSERSKLGLVFGIGLGILLDYNLKKNTTQESISFFNGWLDDLWTDVQRRKNAREDQIREREEAFLTDLTDLSDEEKEKKLLEFRNIEENRTANLLKQRRQDIAFYNSILSLPVAERHEKLAAFEEDKYRREQEEEDDMMLKASLARAEADVQRMLGQSSRSDAPFEHQQSSPSDEKTSLPKDEYWGNLFSSVIFAASIILVTHGLKMAIGHFRPAGLPPGVFDNLPRGGIPGLQRPVLPQGIFNLPPLPVDIDVVGNPIRVVPAPTELQILAALPRRGAEFLAGEILRDTLEQTGIFPKIRQLSMDAVSAGVVAGKEMFEPIFEDFKTTYLNKVVARRENTYLTNENLLLMQNPDGSEAFSLLHGFGTGRRVAPAAVRLPRDLWEALTADYARKVNITPIQKVGYTEVLDRAKEEVRVKKEQMTLEELEKKRKEAEDALQPDPEYEISMPSADLLMRNNLSLVQVNDILSYGPPMMLKFGQLIVEGEHFFADWYIPGFNDQIEMMRYSNPSTGESVSLEIPLDSSLEFSEMTVEPVKRSFLPGEHVKRNLDDREYIVLAPNHNRNFYVVREFKHGEAKRLLVLPGDSLSKVEMRPEDLLGYETPAMGSVIRGEDLDDVFDELEEAYTNFGMFKGKIATHVEFEEGGGIRMKVQAGDKMRYLKLNEKSQKRAEPIQAIRDLSPEEAKAYLGVRSQNGDNIQEIVYVEGNFGLAAESGFQDGKWVVRKYFLMPLTEMTKRSATYKSEI